MRVKAWALEVEQDIERVSFDLECSEIRNGKERIDLAALEDPEIWRGIAPAGRSPLRPAALAKAQA
jgi:hypothetical protein